MPRLATIRHESARWHFGGQCCLRDFHQFAWNLDLESGLVVVITNFALGRRRAGNRIVRHLADGRPVTLLAG